MTDLVTLFNALFTTWWLGRYKRLVSTRTYSVYTWHLCKYLQSSIWFYIWCSWWYFQNNQVSVRN